MAITVRRGGGPGSYQQAKALADQQRDIEQLQVQNNIALADLALISGDYLTTGAIGVTVQAYDGDLSVIAGLAKTDGNFIVGNGMAWVAESGATARASIGALALVDAPVAVASLPGSPSAGQRAIVNDANATTFASVVAAGGANVVPVYYDGADWRIG